MFLCMYLQTLGTFILKYFIYGIIINAMLQNK